MTKRDRITFDLGELRERLLKMAKEPGQSLSSIIRMALVEWLSLKESSKISAKSDKSPALLLASAVQANYAKLVERSGIQPARLQKLAEGNPATQAEIELIIKCLGEKNGLTAKTES